MKRISNFSKSLALVAPVMAMATADSEAAAYIKFDGVDGEAKESKFEGYLKVEFFKVEIEGAGGREGPVLKDLVISLPMEKSSPTLLLACATGQVLKDATLVLTKPTDAGTEEIFVKIELKNVIVSSYSSSGKENEVPTDQITLGYTEVEWTYISYGSNGEIKETVTTPPILRK